MFGYVKPFIPDLKVSEYETYKAVYCGLCKELGKSYGPFARLTLSYDYAFLAMVFLSIRDDDPGFEKKCCAVNPFKKKTCACKSTDMSFVASAAMVMLYYKLKDDQKDGGIFRKIRAGFLLLFVLPAKRRAYKRYPELLSIVSEAMKRQDMLEKAKEESIDKAADPTANALGMIFEYMAKDADTKRVLYRFGYLIGRYVYLTDAVDDMESDIKSGGYNPFVCRAGIKNPDDPKLFGVRAEAKESVYLTIAQAAAAFELLPKKRYQPILTNIVYLGLPDVINNILNKDKETKDSGRIEYNNGKPV